MSSSSPRSDALITKLNSNDVLFGRGAGLREYIGNQLFRGLIQERKEEYLSTNSHVTKNKISQDICDRIHANGGRFLKLASGTCAPRENTIEEGVWEEQRVEQALEKIKQALRENREKNTLRRNGRDTKASSKQAVSNRSCPTDATQVDYAPSSSEVASSPFTGLLHREPITLESSTAGPMSTLPYALTGMTMPSSVDTRRLLLFQAALQQSTASNPFHFDVTNGTSGITQGIPNNASQSQPGMNERGILKPASRSHEEMSVLPQGITNTASQRDQAMPQRTCPQNGFAPEEAGGVDSNRSARVWTSDMECVEKEASSSADYASDLELLSSLATKPRFTDEQEAEERATMTDEEKAEALADMFGKCRVGSPESKRAKRDLDDEAIRFLVKQMWLEIDRIPDDQKRSLLEAQTKCHEDEFSDDRLEQFLRCEGMNAKLAAQRFVRYWESRRDIFGPGKYVLRMTLSEALRDDLVALETGYCCLLPLKDVSGRQLMFWDTRRQTKEGYTSESMLRAIWYVVEVASQENNHIERGNVHIIWDKDSKLGNYDSKVDDRVCYLDRFCWPHRNVASHSCCSPGVLIRILKPFILALLDKWDRSRLVIHDLPDDQLLDALSSYGIEKEVLPIQMGGTLEFNQLEWIANRRAVELEEI